MLVLKKAIYFDEFRGKEKIRVEEKNIIYKK